MKSLIKIKILFLVLLTQLSMGQTNENFIKISEKLESYFSLKREVISVQFNKSTYLTNEKIWFKGYVLDRKTKNLDSSTTNVYFQLFNDKGEEISKQLLFCFNGTFIGDQILDLKLASGKYYARFFTNYMNNFKEDESSVYEIEIINPFNEESLNNTFNENDVRIQYFSESQKIIENVSSQITVKVTDCKGLKARNLEMKLLDSNENILQSFKLNSFGIGRFDFLPLPGVNYKIQTTINGKELSENLKVNHNTGLVLSANNFALKDKCIIKLKTNAETFKFIENKKYFIVVHQNENALIYEKIISSNTFEETLIINNNTLNNGINTIRVLDEDMNEVCYRNVFKFPDSNANTNFEIEKSINEIKISSSQIANMSISVLPVNSLAKTKNNSLKGTFLIDSHLNSKIENIDYFFEGDQRIKAFELDMWIVCHNNPKYEWKNIFSEDFIKEKYPVETGLTIKGTVNNELKNSRLFTLEMFSAPLGIQEITSLDKSNNFKFENLILIDSTYINFQLLKNNNEKVALKSNIYVENNEAKFKFPWVAPTYQCIEINNISKSQYSYRLPNITNENIIELEGIEVKATKTDQILSNKSKNNGLRGYKITPEMENANYTLLNFIERNGFIVNRYPGQGVSIFTRGSSTMSLNAARPKPIVFINDIQHRDFSLLEMMLMTEVDEIYLNTTHLEPSLQNYVGKIVIYTKMGWKAPMKSKDKPTEFLVKNGFSPRNIFKNNQYQSTNDDGFENYGVIHWEPFLEQKDGTYSIQFNALGRDKFFVQIEGITNDGKLISIQQLLN